MLNAVNSISATSASLFQRCARAPCGQGEAAPPDGDRKTAVVPQHRAGDVARAERRVRAQHPHPGGAAGFRDDRGVNDQPEGACALLLAPPGQPGDGNHRSARRGEDDAKQRVQPLHHAVTMAGALGGITEGRLHGVIDVDVGKLVGAGQQRSAGAQVDQQPRRERVELSNMTEGEGPEEQPKRARGADAGEQPAHHPMPR